MKFINLLIAIAIPIIIVLFMIMIVLMTVIIVMLLIMLNCRLNHLSVTKLEAEQKTHNGKIEGWMAEAEITGLG